MSNVISVGYGKENWAEHGVRIAAFLCAPPFKRDFPSKARKRRGNTQTFPASDHPEINGTLFLDTLEASEGDVVMLQVTRTWKGARSGDAAVFFRVRSTGPMVIMHVKLLADLAGRKNGEQFAIFQGRADRLTKRELRALSFDVSTKWADAYMNDDEIEEITEVRQLDAGSAAKPTFERVQNSAGEVKVVTVERSRRRIRVR
jgi:hypothetical protein